MKEVSMGGEYGEMKNTHSILIQKPEAKRPPGRPKHRWNNSIDVDLKGIRRDGMN